MFSLPENVKISLLYQGAANAVSCDVVCMAQFIKGWFIIVHTGSTDTDLTLSLYEATDVTAGTNAAVTKTCPIWIDTDAGTTSDTVAVTTAAYSITIDPATQNGVVAILEWDPAKHTPGYDCVYLVDSGGNAANFCTILFAGQPRYQGASLPSAITD